MPALPDDEAIDVLTSATYAGFHGELAVTPDRVVFDTGGPAPLLALDPDAVVAVDYVERDRTTTDTYVLGAAIVAASALAAYAIVNVRATIFSAVGIIAALAVAASTLTSTRKLRLDTAGDTYTFENVDADAVTELVDALED